ncbi:MAG: lysophospholipid acyltransferase family protein [Bacteroidota bacterium]
MNENKRYILQATNDQEYMGKGKLKDKPKKRLLGINRKKYENGEKSRISYASFDDPFFKRLLIEAIEFAFGRKKIENLLDETKQLDLSEGKVWGIMKEKLELDLDVDLNQLKKVSTDVPVIFIANHPFGVVDGVILGYLISQVKSEFFILVNSVLTQEEALQPYTLPIDFAETKEAMMTNIQTRKDTMERISKGEIMGVFPAGGVATAIPAFSKAEDLEWKRFVGKIIQQLKATVVPIYFHGQNSRWFQLASSIHMNLRLAMFLNEVKNKIGKTLKITIGDPIPFEEMAHIKNRQALLDHLREVTLALGEGEAVSQKTA